MRYTKYKKGNRHGFPFYILYRIPIKELHTFFRNRNSNKRRIRFLTDAKVALFSGYMVVAFVVFAVVFTVVGLQMRFLFFMVPDRSRALPMDDTSGSFVS